MTANEMTRDLLTAPLDPRWTIEDLAERVLRAIAEDGTCDAPEVIIDLTATSDPQSRRLLRPLLACLAVKHAAECGSAPDVYGGRLSFIRQGPHGAIRIVGEFVNNPGNVRVTLRRPSLTVGTVEPPSTQPALPADKIA